MDLGLQDKVALVCASSRGLGKAVAAELHREGAALMICGRDEAALQAAREQLDTGAAPVESLRADLTDPEDIDRLLETTSDRLGRIDVLVTNTGGPPAGPFESHGRETWQEAVRQNFDSVVNLCRGALPGMKERRFGRIVNITSIAVKQPVDGLILSNSIRAAVTGFARTLANEVAPFGVTVNNVMPGYTRTDRLEELAQKIGAAAGQSRDQAIGEWEKAIPMGRIAEPEEFAALVAFLCSTRASYITGSSIAVDGGWIRSLL